MIDLLGRCCGGLSHGSVIITRVGLVRLANEVAVENAVLTNRDIASLVVMGLLVLVVALVVRKIDGVYSAFASLLRIGLVRIRGRLLLHLVGISAAVGAAAQIGLWGADMWKETILWFLAAGLGLLLRFKEVVNEPRFFRHELTRTVGVVAVVEFLANLSSFALWVEIPMQALAVFFLIVKSGDRSEDDPKAALAARAAEAYLVLVGLAALAWTMWRIVVDWQEINSWALLRGFLLPIWLTPVSLLCAYVVAVVAAYRLTFRRMRVTGGGQNLFRQRLAVTLRTAGRPSLIEAIRPQSQRIGATGGFREAWQEIGRLSLESQRRATC